MKQSLVLGVAGLVCGAALLASPARSADPAVKRGAAPAGATARDGAPNRFDFPEFIDTGNGRVEHVMGGAVVSGYGGNYPVLGPQRQGAIGGYGGVPGRDADGNLYFSNHNLNRVTAVINGRIAMLAGTGARGFTDDCPAGEALFDIRPYMLHGCCAVGSPAAGKGAVFVVDNQRIRRIWRKNGVWWVDTYAGGGDKVLAVGDKAPARTLKLNLTDHAVCEDRAHPGVVLTLDSPGVKQGAAAGLLRITADGMAEKIAVPAEFRGQGLQTDAQGRLYGWMREFNFLRYDLKTRKVDVLAVDNPPDRQAILAEMVKKYGKVDGSQWDGPADMCEWFCPAMWTISPSGDVLYAGGGDDWGLRRVKGGFVKTLFSDGKFHIRQAVKGPAPAMLNFGAPWWVDANGAVFWGAGPYMGSNCVVRYLAGESSEAEGE